MSHQTVVSLLEHKCTRRTLLKGAAALASIAVISVAGTAHAQQKLLEKSAVKYQDTPKDGKDCVSCMHFVAGSTVSGAGAVGTCKIVSGGIAAAGYCLAFTRKPAPKSAG